MKSLAYIPTKVDKQRIYAEIEEQRQPPKDHLRTDGPIPHEQDIVNHKKLSKQQLGLLLRRLTQNTKKEYNTEQQTTHILAVNLELKKRRQQGEKVENRLLDYGRKVEEKKEELARQVEAENKEKYYREVPQITSKAKNLNQKAIDKRLHEVMERKINKREQLLEKYLPTFQPIINPQSDFITELQNYGDLHNRMGVREKEASRRKESLVKAMEQKKRQELTFKPAINANSKAIADNLPERKALSVATPKGRSSSQITKPINRQVYPFAPTINKNTEHLINKKGSFESDCFRRLYNNAKDMLAKQQGKVEQRNRAYTFQPELNNYSLKIAATVKKHPKQQTIKQFSEEKGSEDEYEQIKIGNGDNLDSRKKAYSVRNTKQSSKDWQVGLKQKCVNVLHRNGRTGAVLLR